MQNENESAEIYAPDLLDKGISEYGYVFLADDKTPIKVDYLEYDQLAVFDGDIVVATAARMKQHTALVEGLLAQGLDEIPHPQVIIDMRRLWPQGKVYYSFDTSVDEANKKKINTAIANITTSCKGVSFTPRTTQPNYISFTMGDGCSSYVGMQGGKQAITLSRNGYVIGNVIHEISHALGLLHEHTKPNRDKYVQVHKDNIITRALHNFDIVNHPNLFKSMDYDYGSIMHYGRTAFAKTKGTETLTPTQAGASIGQRSQLSKLDKEGINALYTGKNVYQDSL